MRNRGSKISGPSRISPVAPLSRVAPICSTRATDQLAHLPSRLHWRRSLQASCEHPDPPLWTPAGNLNVLRGPNCLHLAWKDGSEAILGLKNRTLSLVGPWRVARDARIAGPVLAHWLRVQGHLVLHAGALQARDGGVIAIVGPPGRGKSTAVAVGVDQGAAFWADDLLALSIGQRGVVCLPGRPVIRRIRGDRKVTFRVPIQPSRPCPLRLLACLERGGDASWRVVPLQGVAAAKAILSNVYGTYADEQGTHDSGTAALRLVSQVPVVRLICPSPVSSLRRCFAAIWRELQ